MMLTRNFVVIDLKCQWNTLSKIIPLSHTISDQTSQAQTMKLTGKIGMKKMERMSLIK